jgi:hypothetical protein
MTNTISLYELILNLLRDPKALEDFRDDPDAYLASCGNFTSDDVKDAIELIRDNDDDDGHGRDGGHPVHVAPPSNPPEPRDGETEHEAAVRYLNTYVTNNYIDDRDTITDNSINQQIDNRGGIFDQDIDVDSNVASGDGAVAADDITDSNVVTGDDNVVGDDNVTGDDNVVGEGNEVVQGDGNTTSFGDGDATSTDIGGDVTVGEGGGFASGGDVDIDNTDNSVDIENSGNVDNSTTEDNDVRIEDSFQDNRETTVEDSFQDNSDNSDNRDNSQNTTLEIEVEP